MPDPLFWAGADEAAGVPAVADGTLVKVAAVAELMELAIVEARVGPENGMEVGPGAILEASGV